METATVSSPVVILNSVEESNSVAESNSVEESNSVAESNSVEESNSEAQSNSVVNQDDVEGLNLDLITGNVLEASNGFLAFYDFDIASQLSRSAHQIHIKYISKCTRQIDK